MINVCKDEKKEICWNIYSYKLVMLHLILEVSVEHLHCQHTISSTFLQYYQVADMDEGAGKQTFY